MDKIKEIKAIIGLGNPGQKYYKNRHNIGFQILDALAEKFNASWKSAEKMEVAEIQLNNKNILLIKPQTFMNSSGEVCAFLQKKGIKDQNILVIHDELELPFGTFKIRFSGSAKGHNGLKSIISSCGADFYRLRFGISRPENREDVPDYVLQDFSKAEQIQLKHLIDQVIVEIERIV